MSPLQFPSTTDIVFVDTLHSSATIGPDCWGRIRAQPINVSIYLHLEQSYLDISGQTDNVLDTVNYGRLTKVISTLLDTPRSEDDPYSIDSLILAIGKQAFELSDADGVEEVRIVLGIPKMILLASNFSIEATVSRMDPSVLTSKRVLVHDLVVPVVIGVNGHERRERQRVVVNIIFYEGVGPKSPVDYQKLIRDLFKDLESSHYETLEAFARETAQEVNGTMTLDHIQGVTVKAQKPSALGFAESSGVEITRIR